MTPRTMSTTATPSSSRNAPPHAALRASQLLMELNDVRPRVWRRIRVPGAITLDRLHYAIQASMGWNAAHRHVFIIGRSRYAHCNLDNARPAEQYALQDVIPEPGAVLHYIYDFGDDWFHTIMVETLEPVERPMKVPAECLDGKNACPPEDCGGPPGYARLRSVLKRPNHPEYDELRAWVSTGFDPKMFDVARANARLKSINKRTCYP